MDHPDHFCTIDNVRPREYISPRSLSPVWVQLTGEARAAPEAERGGVDPPAVTSVGHVAAQEEA